MIPAIWNFVRRLGLYSQRAVLIAWNSLRLFFARAANTVYFGAFAIMVLVGFGVLFGFIGYKAEIGWLVGLGQFLIAVGGMIATAALGVFYLKVGVITTHGLVAVDGFLEFISRGKLKSFFSKETGANVRNDFLNAFAWIAAFCLWCNVIPVWKWPIAIPIGVTFGFFFAFASARSWTFVEKPIGKAVVFVVLAFIFVFHSVNAVTAGALSEWVGSRGELARSEISVSSASALGRRSVLEQRAAFEQSAAKARVSEYQKLARKQLGLIRKGRERSEQFRTNARRMNEIESGLTEAATAPRPRPPSGPRQEAANYGSAFGKLAAWAGSNWGVVLLGALTVLLLVLLVVGLVTKEKWLAMTATAVLLLLGLAGAGIWLGKEIDFGRPNATPLLPQIAAESPAIAQPRVATPSLARQRRSERPLGLRQGLDAIVPEQPGEWQ